MILSTDIPAEGRFEAERDWEPASFEWDEFRSRSISKSYNRELSWHSTDISQHSSSTNSRGQIQPVIPRKMNGLSEDILVIVNKWYKERSGYQTTLNAFQVKSLGAISYKDTIAKCNLARDELMKARFKLAEEELATGPK